MKAGSDRWWAAGFYGGGLIILLFFSSLGVITINLNKIWTKVYDFT